MTSKLWQRRSEREQRQESISQFLQWRKSDLQEGCKAFQEGIQRENKEPEVSVHRLRGGRGTKRTHRSGNPYHSAGTYAERRISLSV